jgi:hypothetical protein
MYQYHDGDCQTLVLHPVGRLQVQPLNPADQLACEGVEVAAGAPLLLVHYATAKPLNLECCTRLPTCRSSR